MKTLYNNNYPNINNYGQRVPFAAAANKFVEYVTSRKRYLPVLYAVAWCMSVTRPTQHFSQETMLKQAVFD